MGTESWQPKENKQMQSATFLPIPFKVISFSFTSSYSPFTRSLIHFSPPFSEIILTESTINSARYPNPIPFRSSGVAFNNCQSPGNSWKAYSFQSITFQIIFLPNLSFKERSKAVILEMLLFEEQIKDIVHSHGSCFRILVPGNFRARALNLCS